MTVRLEHADISGVPDGLTLPDVYFTPGYGSSAAVMDHATWHLTHWEDRILVPWLRRDVNGADHDGVSPYGYSGVYVHPDCSPADLARFWSLAVAHWREQRVVSLFLRFSPLDPYPVEVLGRLGTVPLTARGDTVAVPVDRGVTAAWDGMQGRSRTAIRKARNSGLAAGIRACGPTDVAPGSPFRCRYEETMRRVGSRPAYLFADAYYDRLIRGVGKDLLLAEVWDGNGMVVAAALVLRHRDRVHYHLAGSEPVAARDGANNLLVWTIIEWAAENGGTITHLGGGVSPDDRLFQFKRSFGGELRPFHTGAVVVDPERYRALVDERAGQLGQDPADLAASSFFPAYRVGG